MRRRGQARTDLELPGSQLKLVVVFAKNRAVARLQ